MLSRKQEILWLFNVERKKSIGKKTEDGKNLFFEVLANRLWLTLTSYSWLTMLFMADLLSKGLHEKVNDMLLKVD